jgi:hypothetical protein
MKQKKNDLWVVKQLVPEEVYTDREEFIDYFYDRALRAATRRTMSTVLLGQRRMGKTEIFKRVVNRLFIEQDPRDPDAVVPVYFSFDDRQIDNKTFALEYLENFLRFYVGFYTRNHELARGKLRGERLFAVIEDSRKLFPFTKTFDWIFEWYEQIEKDISYVPHKDALTAPRTISDVDESTIVMFLDEFQNTRLPQYDFDIVGIMQEAAESPTCPHFVTGSAMSILEREIIGRGSLFGRFDGMYIKAFSDYWGAELVLRSTRYYNAQVSEIMAPVVAERCGGNPFYITAVVQQAEKLNKPLFDEETLNEVMAVDISSGFIWGELNDQVTRWIDRLNEHKITKWILYLSALEEGEKLNLKRIQRELKLRERKDVSLEHIRDVLVKLARGDLLEFLEFGGWFRKVKDPVLLEFLKVWGKIEVEGYSADKIQADLVFHYGQLKRRFSEYQGYLAEVFMVQVLWTGQRKTLPGRFFHSPENITLPHRFFYIEQRVRLGSGKGREIDIIGAAGLELWVCESKWRKGRKTGKAEIETLIQKADEWRGDKDYKPLRKWIFSHDGLTEKAEEFAAQKGVLWSSRSELDEMLLYLGLRKLPDV